MTNSYDALGASHSKAGLHAALSRSGLATESGLFASVYPDFAGDPQYRGFVHCDGAGTKSIVAYLLYRETGDPSVFAGLAQDAFVMNLDDVFCIGRPDSLMLSNMIARNAKLVDDHILEILLTAYRQLQQELAQLGVPVTLSGGETADCGDVVRTLLVDAILAGRISLGNLINAQNITSGDVIVGLSSTGRTTYEKSFNSGIGSNGLTLARHALLHAQYRAQYPEVVDATLSPEVSYRGKYRVTDTTSELSAEGGFSIGSALLSPTRTYAPVLNRVYEKLGKHVHAVIHNTGGGQTKVLRFAKNKLIIKDNLFKTPALFRHIQESGGVAWREMYQVFNMGHRMEIYLPSTHAAEILEISREFGLEAQIIGSVQESKTGSTTVHLAGEHGTFEYTLN